MKINSVKRAKEVLGIEAEAIKDLRPRIGKDFEKALGLILKTKDRVIISGMGKTGIIAQNFPQLWLQLVRPVYFCTLAKQSTEI